MKYWYFIDDIGAIDILSRLGIFCIWGAVPGLLASAQPGSSQYLICVNWAGRSLDEKAAFEAQAGISPLPHKDSRQPVSPSLLAKLAAHTATGTNPITLTDHTHDLVEKLSSHVGWAGWWQHL